MKSTVSGADMPNVQVKGRALARPSEQVGDHRVKAAGH